jgi:uncharacterized protein YndB with AHSA1/START domain
MPSVTIQAPPNVVFEAMCDLTRHAKWAKHDIVIEAGQEGPSAVGNTYTCSEKGATPDQLTVTELVPTELFRFHSHMSRGMGWDFDFTMTARPEGDGTMVTRDAKITKFPIFMLPMKLLMSLIGPGLEQNFLNNMKADLEAGSSP